MGITTTLFHAVSLVVMQFPLCPIVAQSDTTRNSKRIVSNVDEILDKRDNRLQAKTDTIYIQQAPERLRLFTRVNVSGSNIVIRGKTDNGNYKSTLEAQLKSTLSLSASYRGLTLGVAINPARLAGKNKDYEFNVNAYGNRMGADIIFQSTNTYKGSLETNTTKTDIPTGLVRQNMLYFNAYYALNARKFSYPAAYSQSWIQRKSSGSIMFGMSFVGGNMRMAHSEALGNAATRLSIANIAIGAGYGYNYVARKNWLLHISTLPQIVIFSRQHTTVNGSYEKSPYKFPNIIAVGRIAVIRHFRRSFLGFTTIVNTFSTGDHDTMQLSAIKWRARLFLGIKFF